MGKKSKNGRGKQSHTKRFSTYGKGRRVDKCDIWHFKDKPHITYYFYFLSKSRFCFHPCKIKKKAWMKPTLVLIRFSWHWWLWKSCRKEGVMASLGRSKRNWEDNDSEKQKSNAERWPKTSFVHPTVQSKAEDMVTSFKESLSEKDMKEIISKVISCILRVYNGKLHIRRAQNYSGDQGSTCLFRFWTKGWIFNMAMF